MDPWPDILSAYTSFAEQIESAFSRDGSQEHGGLNAEHFVSMFSEFNNAYGASTAKIMFLIGVQHHKLTIIQDLSNRYCGMMDLDSKAVGTNNIIETVSFGIDPGQVAETHYRISIDLRPDWGPPHYNLASLRLRAGDLESARSNFEAAAGSGSQLKSDAALHLAMIAEDAGDLDQAEQHYLSATKSDRHFGKYQRRIAEFFRGRGRIELAMLHYNRTLEFDYPLAPELAYPADDPDRDHGAQPEEENMLQALLKMKNLLATDPNN
jgi:tetratricopeptide (TPR) repeat protein